jgi:hypothetical protein
MDDQSSLMERKKRKFPFVQDTGDDVYNVETVVFRDNSRFVTELIGKSNVLFTRPPQMGKTTMLSLADLLLSNTKTAPSGLASYPDEANMNSWYVIRIDFGGVRYTGASQSSKWEEMAKGADKEVLAEIQECIIQFLLHRKHVDLKEKFYEILTLGNLKVHELNAGRLVSVLARAIVLASERDDGTMPGIKPNLLFLVDEYDKPIRDVLFDYIGTKIPDIRNRLSTAFPEYAAFFGSVKSANTTGAIVTAWVTGVTPVGLTLISDFRCTDYTFDSSMVDAVGLLDSDVLNMLDEAIQDKSFDECQREQVIDVLKFQFNNLRFTGNSLYHTGMMNAAMRRLQNSDDRHQWLRNIADVTGPEELPSSAFNVVKRADTSHLRAIVSQLVDKETVTGYELKRDMSITTLLEEGVLGESQYLTLLVHLGVVAIAINTNNEAEFTSTSEVYRKKHLSALNLALASSIADLLKLESKQKMYEKGEAILLEFLHALSVGRMAGLIAWADSGEGNKILELQLQGNLVETLFQTFEAITTQEDRLDAGRSDITIATDKFKVVLELKKKEGPDGPTPNEWEKHHSQLRSYVEEHRTKVKSGEWVAGFVLVMCNGGKGYHVQSLINDP